MTDAVNEHLRPVRARRRELAADRGYLQAVLRRGNDQAAALAEDMLDSVRKLMPMAQPLRVERHGDAPVAVMPTNTGPAQRRIAAEVFSPSAVWASSQMTIV